MDSINEFVFVYIFNSYSKEEQITIEVQRKNQSNRISQFIRTKSIINTIKPKLSQHDYQIYTLLSILGQKYPPYKLPNWCLGLMPIVATIQKSNNFYIKNNKYASLKRISPQKIKTLLTVTQPPKQQLGELLYGEIYIYHIGTSRLTIGIKFRYQNCPKAIPAQYLLPIPTISKQFSSRDITAEKKILLSLPSKWPLTKETFNIPISDLDVLLNLQKKQWQVFYKKSGNNKQIDSFSFNNTSGINWFEGSNHNSDKDIELYQTIFNSYLEGRNFAELNNKIVFFKNETIEENSSYILAHTVGNISESNNILTKIHSSKNNPTQHNLEKKLELQNFNKSLKKYQKQGVSWLLNLFEQKIGGAILADEMGLGKTAQVLAFLALIHKKNQKTLIIAPASVVLNWKNEINKFIPFFNNFICTEISAIEKNNLNIFIFSYEKVRHHIDKIKNNNFRILVLDEAQKIKNAKTKAYNAIRSINTEFTIIVTGTPIENSITELWNHVSFIHDSFKHLYGNIFSKHPEIIKSAKGASISAKILSPLILQRTKDEVLPELPQKIITNEYVILSSPEQKLYETIKSTFKNAIQDGASARIPSIALEGLLRLRQCCSLPSLLPTSLNSDKITKASKLSRCLELVNDIIAYNKKILIFSQFTKVLNQLEIKLNEDKISFVRLDGSTQNREAPIKLFQQDHTVKVFLIALKAGGFGINLTAAEHIILFEPWWNPAVEDQAFSRAHRIGQNNTVFIHRLICDNTIEEKIDKIIENKKEIITTMSNNLSPISLQDLKYLINS
ncbi:DEAD/DEAH box helicase [Desulfobacterota bacterium M19]